jgi:uncharacterized protein (DUF1330 family)
MNWDALAALGETIGAAAVVVTLFYLARQIRQNTRMARAEMTKDLYLASRAAIMDVTSSDRLAEIWADIRPFKDEAAARRHTFYQSFFRLYELQFNLAQQGLLDDSIATSYQLVIRMFARTRHFDSYWAGARDEFHADFAAHVDSQLEHVRLEKQGTEAGGLTGRTPVEIQIALDVQNEGRYAKYRTAVTPILARYGGKVVHEFSVAETVLSEADVQVNHLLTIQFPDESARKAFFGDPDYQTAKETHFHEAVKSSATLAMYALR